MQNLRAGAAFALSVCVLAGRSAWGQSPAAGNPPLAAPPLAAPPVAAPPVAPASQSVEFSLEDSSVVALAGKVKTKLAIPAGVVAIVASGNRLYVARGTLGVAVYDVTEPLSPRLEREQATNGGYASGFTLVGGQVWVLITSKVAMPVGDADVTQAQSAPVPMVSPPSATTTPPVATPHQPTKAAPPEALDLSIRLVSPGVIEINVGAEQGVRVGDRYTIFRAEEHSVAGGERFVGEHVVGTAEVIAVRSDSCLADLSRMATARPRDYARRTKRSAEEESQSFPQRVANMGEYGAVLRPLINIGTPLGVGVLADFEATYWGSAYFAGVSVQPLGFGTTADGKVVSIAALAEGGYDGSAFAAGLGVGIGWVNGNIDDMLWKSGYADASSGGTTTTTTNEDTHSAFAVSQVVRLGARDGLRLQLRNILLLHRESATSDRGFIYGGTSGKLVVPTSRRTDVFAEGGGGVMGYWFFGLGVGTWIVGNGSPGSMHLSVSAGGAGIYGSRKVTTNYNYQGGSSSYSYTDDFGVAGPMVSIGLTRRFEF